MQAGALIVKRYLLLNQKRAGLDTDRHRQCKSDLLPSYPLSRHHERPSPLTLLRFTVVHRGKDVTRHAAASEHLIWGKDTDLYPASIKRLGLRPIGTSLKSVCLPRNINLTGPDLHQRGVRAVAAPTSVETLFRRRASVMGISPTEPPRRPVRGLIPSSRLQRIRLDGIENGLNLFLRIDRLRFKERKRGYQHAIRLHVG